MKKQLLSLFAILVAFSFSSCGEDEPEGIKTGGQKPDVDITDEEDEPYDFKIPTYQDDYASIAGWNNHDKWNLANVHDPSVAYYDGYYYMYGTDASYGNEHEKAPRGKHFQGKRSKDLVNWEWVPGPLNDAPAWVVTKLNEIRESMNLDPIEKQNISFGFWAPVVRRISVDGQVKLRMYYSIVIDNYIKSGKRISEPFDGSWSERAFIGVCESTDPANGNWKDLGFVTCSSSDKGKDFSRARNNSWADAYFFYNAIDPTYIVTPEGDHYLIHGSWHSGFALLKIDPSTGKPDHELGLPYADNAEALQARYGKRVATRIPTGKSYCRWQGSEAPEVIYKDGYYYLFMAYDGLDVPYNTRVARSRNIDGPYVDIRGVDITTGGDCFPIVTHPYKFSRGYGWVGISHMCAFQNRSGEWFYMSQGRLPQNVGGNAYSNAIMMGHVRRLVWCPSSPNNLDDLWPIALPERYAHYESNKPITADELVGTWEHINLGYNYEKQDQAEALVLEADGSMKGALTGKWSFDAEKKYLTLGNVVVCVERELDWESSPREVTIVYAGTEKSINKTYWGKKID